MRNRRLLSGNFIVIINELFLQTPINMVQTPDMSSQESEREEQDAFFRKGSSRPVCTEQERGSETSRFDY
jgi:hypothetical protein